MDCAIVEELWVKVVSVNGTVVVTVEKKIQSETVTFFCVSYIMLKRFMDARTV